MTQHERVCAFSVRAVGAGCVAAILAWAGGCGSSVRSAGDPLQAALDPRQTPERRAALVHEAFSSAVNLSDRVAARSELWPQVWSDKASPAMKMAIVGELLAEKDSKTAREIRDDLRLMLPHQTSPEVVNQVCESASERGWTDFIPAIVRSYARIFPGITDDLRGERAALLKLAPTASIEETTLGVFLSPPPDSAQTKRLKLAEAYRVAAWDLLARLDRSGEKRLAMLESASGAGSEPIVADVLACRRDFGVLPVTGDELQWAVRLHDPKNKPNGTWWSEASLAVGALSPEARKGLELRHIEIVRWATKNRPAWCTSSREQLLNTVREQLKGRVVRDASVARRTSGTSERLDASADRLAWADLLTILVIDEGVRDGAVIDALFTYRDYDHRDDKTEYGGTIDGANGSAAISSTEPGRFIATLFQPRPGQRRGDDQFVASEDMILQSDRSIAHFHFHAAEVHNAKFAGPSDEDLDYANRQGRTCLVLTSLDSKTMGVDYFQPGVIVIDLGTIEKTR